MTMTPEGLKVTIKKKRKVRWMVEKIDDDDDDNETSGTRPIPLLRLKRVIHYKLNVSKIQPHDTPEDPGVVEAEMPNLDENLKIGNGVEDRNPVENGDYQDDTEGEDHFSSCQEAVVPQEEEKDAMVVVGSVGNDIYLDNTAKGPSPMQMVAVPEEKEDPIVDQTLVGSSLKRNNDDQDDESVDDDDDILSIHPQPDDLILLPNGDFLSPPWHFEPGQSETPTPTNKLPPPPPLRLRPGPQRDSNAQSETQSSNNKNGFKRPPPPPLHLRPRQEQRGTQAPNNSFNRPPPPPLSLRPGSRRDPNETHAPNPSPPPLHPRPRRLPRTLNRHKKRAAPMKSENDVFKYLRETLGWKFAEAMPHYFIPRKASLPTLA